jgi:hypothetical protein
VANPPGKGLTGLLTAITQDAHLTKALLSAGYIQFGKGPDVEYDAVCFDLNSRKKNRERTIVKIDHEESLCNNRTMVVAKLAPNFEQLVKDTINRAAAME